MRWIRIILLVLFIALFMVVLFFSYHHFQKNTREGGEPLNAVPPNAGVILEVREPMDLWEQLSENNIIWERLVKEGPFRRLDSLMKGVDSLFQENEKLASMNNGRGVVLSLHSSGPASVAPQLSVSIPGDVDEKSVRDAILDEWDGELKERTHEEVRLYEEQEGSMTFALHDRILILSRTPILVEDAIRHLKTGDPLDSREAFRTVAQTTGTDAEANLYLNHESGERLLANFLRSPWKELLKDEGGSGEWSGLDLLLRPRSFLFTGFTRAAEDESYLSVLQDQEARTVKIPRALPSRTASFISFGISDIDQLLKRYVSYLKATNSNYEREQALEALRDSCACDVRKATTSWIGHEMAAAYLEPAEDDPLTKKAFIALRTFDSESALRSLKQFTEEEEGEELAGHPDLTVRRMKTDGLYQTLFGHAFPQLSSPYFIIRDEHVFLAERRATLRELVRDLNLDRVLSRNVDFDGFAGSLSKRSNLLLYSNIGRSPFIYTQLLKEEHAEALEERVELLREFQAFAAQFSARPDGKLYTNIQLEYDPVYKKQPASLWETPLDTLMQGRPHLFRNHYTDALEAFVQDLNDKVYLISNTGEILWEKQLEGPLMGELHQVDVYRNGKFQLLFNTAEKVHLLDRKGRYVEDFPIELPEKATAPLALFDYANNKNYRILVPCADKKIHYYDKHAEELDGWGFDGSEESMLRSPQHIRIDKKDYILVTDSAGNVRLLNRRGGDRYQVEERIVPSRHTPLVVEEEKDIGSSALVFTDTNGSVIRQRFDGQRAEFHLRDEMEEPFFFEHVDLEEDGKKEFVLLEDEELAVFEKDEEQRFAYSFDSTIVDPVQSFRFSEELGMVGVLDRKNAKAYLFDREGSLKEGLPLFGKTLFTVGDINRDGYLELLIGSGEGDLYCYGLN